MFATIDGDMLQAFLRSQAVCRVLERPTASAAALSCIMALRKLCNHPSLVFPATFSADEEDELDDEDIVRELVSLFPLPYDRQALNLQHSGKLAVLDAIIRAALRFEPLSKIVVVSNFKQTLGEKP